MIKPLKMAISGYFMCFPRTFVPGPPVCSSLLCRCSSPWLRTPERSNWGWVSIVHGRTRDRLFHPWWQHPSGRRDRYDITEIQLDPSLPGYEHLKCCLFSVDTVIHPASRGVAAHTASLFRSVKGAKGGVEYEEQSSTGELTYITAVEASQAREFSLFPPVGAAQATEFSLFPREASQAKNFHFPPPWGLPKLGNFHFSPPWGLPKLGNFHFSPPWQLPKLWNFHFSLPWRLSKLRNFK